MEIWNELWVTTQRKLLTIVIRVISLNDSLADLSLWFQGLWFGQAMLLDEAAQLKIGLLVIRLCLYSTILVLHPSSGSSSSSRPMYSGSLVPTVITLRNWFAFLNVSCGNIELLISSFIVVESSLLCSEIGWRSLGDATSTASCEVKQVTTWVWKEVAGPAFLGRH